MLWLSHGSRRSGFPWLASVCLVAVIINTSLVSPAPKWISFLGRMSFSLNSQINIERETVVSLP